MRHSQTEFGMFTDGGNAAVAELMEDLLSMMVPIGDGLVPVVSYLNSRIKEIGKIHVEVTDTEVREMIGYFLDSNVREGYLEDLQEAGLDL